MDKSDYASRFEVLMKERGWDAKTTATRIGFSSVAMTKMFAGGRFNVDNLFRAAQVFNVSPFWLHTGKGQRGTWAAFVGGTMPGAASLPASGAISQKAASLAMMYDDLKMDEDAKAVIFRRATAALLGFELPPDNPKSAAPDVSESLKKSSG